MVYQWEIKKDDATYYSYTKLAQGCKLQKETKEYERLFRLQYQDIQVSIRNKTFEEIAIEMNNDDINVKEATRHCRYSPYSILYIINRK